jgi:RNA polymerase sigma-70 factor, ECF subfamily
VSRKGSTYDPARPFLGWLLALTRNGAIDHMRRRRVRAALTDRGQLEQLSAPSRDPATAELVEHALSLIPATYREAVWLCDALGLSYAEASEALQCDIGTVGSRVSRGRQLLREHLMRNGHAM